jgi:hypothetical protein
MDNVFQFNKLYSRPWFFYLVLFLLCSFSVAVNFIPEHYIVSVGDNPYRLNIEKNLFKQIFYQWSNLTGGGSVNTPDITQSFQLLFFYALDYLGFSQNNAQNIRFFLFLFISGFSMFHAIGLLFKNVDPRIKILISLIYTFNHTTLTMSLSGGIYYTYYDMYMVFPLVLALIQVGITNQQYFYYLFYAAIILFFFIGAFSNPAFLFSFFGLIFLYVLLGNKFEKENYKTKILKLSFFTALTLLLLFPYFISYLYNFSSIGLDTLNTAFNLDSTISWAKWTKVLFVDILRLNFIPTKIFPDNYSYNSSIIRVVSIFLSYTLMAAVILSFFINKNEERKTSVAFLIIIVVIMFYSSYMRSHEKILEVFFSLPLSFAVRSPEKLTIFFNSFLLFALACNLNWIYKSSRIKTALFFLLLAALIEPLPFWLGKIHENVSINGVWNNEYHTMVKIPDSYREIANYLNDHDKENYKILSMPYTGEIGVGWSVRKRWKFLGFDTTVQYFDNPVYLPIDGEGNFNFAKKLDASPLDYNLDDFVLELQKRGIKYLIIDENVGGMQHLYNFYSVFKNPEKYFDFMAKFDNLTLFKLKNEYFRPPIQIQSLTPINN